MSAVVFDPVLDPLVDSIESDPTDLSTQLVLADHLQGLGDPRGELIVLAHADNTSPSGLEDPAAIERLLLLAAVYGFPRTHSMLDQMLPFGGSPRPFHYSVHHDSRRYQVRYTLGRLRIDVDARTPYDHRLQLTHAEELDSAQTHIVLTIASDAILARTPLDELRFPYEADPLPMPPWTQPRCYALPEAFTTPRRVARFDYGLAARDYHRWHRLWHRLSGAA